MFQYLRKAVSGSSMQDPRNNLVRDEYRKKKLKENLALRIKNLQKAHVNESHIIERNDEDAMKVCVALEAIFLHGYLGRSPAMDLKNMFVDGIRATDDDILHTSFWELVKGVTHNDVITQLKHLVVTTNVGLCRSWIRLAMNDCLIVSYLDAIVSDKSQLIRFYGPNAFLMDTELTYILKELLQGLMHFEFRLNYNSSKLNTWDMEPLQLAGVVQMSFDKNGSNGKSFGDDTEDLPTARLKDVVSGEKSSIQRSTGKAKRGSSKKKARPTEGLIEDDEEPTTLTSTPTSPTRLHTTDVTLPTPSSPSPSTPNFKKISTVEDLPGLSPGGFLQRKPEVSEKPQDANEEKGQENEKVGQSTPPGIDDTNVENKTETLACEQTAMETDRQVKSSEQGSDSSQVIGNRIGADRSWSIGWSSQFEQNLNANTSDNKITEAAATEIKSFDSLLQMYGNNAAVSYADANNDDVDGKNGGTLQVNDDVDDNERSSKLKKSESMERTDSPASPTLDPSVNQSFEVVPMDTSLRGDRVDKKTQSSLSQLTELGLEVGLDGQSFQCKHCQKAIGLIYGEYRVCYFDGGYYCLDCHNDEEYYVPARVVQNWDFTKSKVCKYNKLFLMKIEEEPLFHMDEINPTLYEIIIELKEVKLLRLQLQHVKEYVQTCRHEVAEDFRIRLWPREYLCDDIHQYSLLDLIQVHNGQLAHHLKKVISQFSKHIYKCSLCREKGFICEYCHDKEIIYPFQVGIAIQCPGCLSTFHRACRKDKRCPKCVRIHLRSQSRDGDDMDRRLIVASKDFHPSTEIF